MGAACYYCPLLSTPRETLPEQEGRAQMHDTTESRPERNGGLTEMQALGYFRPVDLLHYCLSICICIFLIQVALFPFLKKTQNIYVTFNKK